MASTLLAERYELLDDLGSGGMARVWRARDRRLNREVAVKVLSELLASDRAFRERFEREAMHVASLKHPNIVTVHDYGNEGGIYYIVMELVDGQSLQAMLDETSPYLDIGLAVRLCSETLAGLAHADDRGIVHRDIKPANILITREVTTKLADFGIARATADAGSLTTTGSFIGTPSYASPEQLSGLPSTAVTDQYSLGCVLYQCLTGRPPFEAEIPAGVMAQHLHNAPEPPREHRPEIPPAMEAVVLRALEKEPERRFDSAAHMQAALLNAADTGTDRAGAQDPTIVKAGAPQADSARGTRHPRPLWQKAAMVGAPVLAAVLYLAIAVGASLPPFGSGSSSRATTPTTATRQASQPPVSSAVATGFDSCLVGRWTLQSATVPFTVSLTGQSVPITGGKGATVTFTADGTQTEDYGNSAPFQGTVNGESLVVNLRGIGELRATANNRVLSIISGSTAGITGTAALAGGVPTSFQGSPVGGTAFSYTCSANKLNATSPGETFALTRS